MLAPCIHNDNGISVTIDICTDDGGEALSAGLYYE